MDLCFRLLLWSQKEPGNTKIKIYLKIIYSTIKVIYVRSNINWEKLLQSQSASTYFEF